MNVEMTLGRRNSSETAVELLRHLTALEIRYALLHGFDRLDTAAHDIDIVVHPADVRRCIDELRAWDVFSLVQVLRYEATGLGLVLARCDDVWEAFTLDVTTDYRWSGRIFLTNAELLARRRLVDGVWRANARVELSFLLLKKFVEKGEVPAHQQERIATLARTPGTDAAAVYRELLGEEMGAGTHAAILAGDWTSVLGRTREIRHVMRQRAAAKHPARVIQYWTAELARRLGRVLRPTGVLVALLGPDGAGKSTIAAELCRTTFGPFRRTRRFHFRPGLVAGRAANDGPTAARPPRGTVASIAKLFLYLADVWAGHLLIVRPALSRSTLVVFDRYFHDLLVDERRYAYGGPKRLLAWAARLVPRPDLFLFVVADPRSIQDRKGELTERDARTRIAAYLELAQIVGGTVIYGDSGVDAAVCEAQNALSAAMSRRAGRCAERRPARERRIGDRTESSV
jgi:thymidylate kinase